MHPQNPVNQIIEFTSLKLNFRSFFKRVESPKDSAMKINRKFSEYSDLVTQCPFTTRD
jgi:hypothetical protein